MEQEHGTDAAAICKGVLLRIGMAAAMSTAVLGFLSYHVLPRLRKTDYIKMVSDADAQTALTLASLVLLAICCLCVYPLIGHGKRSRADVVAVACTVATVALASAYHWMHSEIVHETRLIGDRVLETRFSLTVNDIV